MTNRLCLNCMGRDSRDAHVHPHVPLTLPMPQSACASFVSNSFCTVRDRQTETRPFVSALCLSGASILWGDEQRCFIEIEGGGSKNPGSTNKYTKFGELIIRKIIKIIASKMGPNLIPGVCPFVSWVEFDT